MNESGIYDEYCLCNECGMSYQKGTAHSCFPTLTAHIFELKKRLAQVEVELKSHNDT